MPYINSIGLANAPYKHPQKNILDFVLSIYDVPNNDIEKIKRLYDRCEIETRYSCINDFSLSKNDWTFFDKVNPTSIEKRMNIFFEIAPSLAEKAIEDCIKNIYILKDFTHLITVSCTGLAAPGLDILLLAKLDFNKNIHRSSINFMGCYAAIHALKQANDICNANKDAKVLIVDVELCTIHFQQKYSMENIASSLLFADGAAAVVVSNEIGLYQIEHFFTEVALQGLNDMAWQVSSHGFLMSLSTYVPEIISENIKPLLENSLKKMSMKFSDIHHWAIHPGGKKIISEIQKTFLLKEEDIEVSKQILNDFGNMSSVTILYVLQKMLSKIKNKNENIYCAGFGPGLTLETMFLKSC